MNIYRYYILLSCLCMGTQILLGWTHASIVYGAKCMPTTKEELCMHANPNACCGVGTLEMTLKFGSGGGQASQMEQAKV